MSKKTNTKRLRRNRSFQFSTLLHEEQKNELGKGNLKWFDDIDDVASKSATGYSTSGENHTKSQDEFTTPKYVYTKTDNTDSSPCLFSPEDLERSKTRSLNKDKNCHPHLQKTPSTPSTCGITPIQARQRAISTSESEGITPLLTTQSSSLMKGLFKTPGSVLKSNGKTMAISLGVDPNTSGVSWTSSLATPKLGIDSIQKGDAITDEPEYKSTMGAARVLFTPGYDSGNSSQEEMGTKLNCDTESEDETLEKSLVPIKHSPSSENNRSYKIVKKINVVSAKKRCQDHKVYKNTCSNCCILNTPADLKHQLDKSDKGACNQESGISNTIKGIRQVIGSPPPTTNLDDILSVFISPESTVKTKSAPRRTKRRKPSSNSEEHVITFPNFASQNKKMKLSQSLEELHGSHERMSGAKSAEVNLEECIENTNYLSVLSKNSDTSEKSEISISQNPSCIKNENIDPVVILPSKSNVCSIHQVNTDKDNPVTDGKDVIHITNIDSEGSLKPNWPQDIIKDTKLIHNEHVSGSMSQVKPSTFSQKKASKSPGEDLFTQISPAALNAMCFAAELSSSEQEDTDCTVIDEVDNCVSDINEVVSDTIYLQEGKTTSTPLKWKNDVENIEQFNSSSTPNDNKSANSSTLKSFSLKNRRSKRFFYPTTSQISDVCPKKVFNFEKNPEEIDTSKDMKSRVITQSSITEGHHISSPCDVKEMKLDDNPKDVLPPKQLPLLNSGRRFSSGFTNLTNYNKQVKRNKNSSYSLKGNSYYKDSHSRESCIKDNSSKEQIITVISAVEQTNNTDVSSKLSNVDFHHSTTNPINDLSIKQWPGKIIVNKSSAQDNDDLSIKQSLGKIIVNKSSAPENNARSRGFSTAGGKTIKLSTKSLDRAKRIMQELDSEFGNNLDENIPLNSVDNKDLQPKNNICSLSTDHCEKDETCSEVAVNGKAEGQKKLTTVTTTILHDSELSPNKLAVGKVKVNNVKCIDNKFQNDQNYSDESAGDSVTSNTIINESNVSKCLGFQCASGESVKMSESSLKKANAIINSIDRECDQLNYTKSINAKNSEDNPQFGGIDMNKVENYKDDNVDKLNSNIQNDFTLCNNVIGFKCASGKAINISNSAMKKANSIIDGVRNELIKDKVVQDNLLDNNKIPVNSVGFQCASGKGIDISESALLKATSLVQQVEKEVNHQQIVSNSGFQSASGKGVPLSESSLSRAHALIQQVNAEMRPNPNALDHNLDNLENTIRDVRNNSALQGRPRAQLPQGFRPFKPPRMKKLDSEDKSNPYIKVDASDVTTRTCDNENITSKDVEMESNQDQQTHIDELASVSGDICEEKQAKTLNEKVSSCKNLQSQKSLTSEKDGFADDSFVESFTFTQMAEISDGTAAFLEMDQSTQFAFTQYKAKSVDECFPHVLHISGKEHCLKLVDERCDYESQMSERNTGIDKEQLCIRVDTVQMPNQAVDITVKHVDEQEHTEYQSKNKSSLFDDFAVYNSKVPCATKEYCDISGSVKQESCVRMPSPNQRDRNSKIESQNSSDINWETSISDKISEKKLISEIDALSTNKTADKEGEMVAPEVCEIEKKVNLFNDSGFLEASSMAPTCTSLLTVGNSICNTEIAIMKEESLFKGICNQNNELNIEESIKNIDIFVSPPERKSKHDDNHFTVETESLNCSDFKESSNILPSAGFTTAKGTKIEISAKSLGAARLLLGDEVNITLSKDTEFQGRTMCDVNERYKVDCNQKSINADDLKFDSDIQHCDNLHNTSSGKHVDKGRRILKDIDMDIGSKSPVFEENMKLSQDHKVPVMSDITSQDEEMILKTYVNASRLSDCQAECEKNEKYLNADLETLAQVSMQGICSSKYILLNEDEVANICLPKQTSLCRGFQVVKNVLEQGGNENKEDLKNQATKSLFEENQKSHAFVGFQTASGKNVSVSQKALQAAKSLLEEYPKNTFTAISNVQIEKENKVSKIESKLNLAKSCLTDKSSLSEKITAKSTPIKVTSSSNMSLPFGLNEKNNMKERLNGLEMAEDKGNVSEKGLQPTKTLSGASENKVIGALQVTKSLFEESTRSNAASFNGFQTASVKRVEVSDDSLHGAKSLFEEDMQQNSTKFCGFQTASGNKVTVSDKALQATKSLFEESTKSNVPSSGFQTASGNKVTVSDNSLQATKSLFEESTNLNPASSGFQTTSGNKVTVSDKVLQATKSLFEESTKSNAPSSGFQTASGNKVTESDKALQATKSLFEESTKSNAPSSGFQTASGNKVTVSDKALQATKSLFEQSTQSNASSSGFQTASGNKVTVSDKALQATKSLFEESTKSNAASSGFQTASRNKVTVSDKALQATKSLFEESRKSNAPSSGFQTASGNKVTVSDKALQATKDLFEESTNSNPASSGFQTASGNKVTVSDKALQATKSLFEESKKSNAPSSGFQTASGNKITVSDKALQATKSLFEESTKSNAPSSGFQTASGNNVTVSDKALQATKSLFEESTKSNAAPSGFQTASGNKVTVSDKALQATKSLFDESTNPATSGFQTASGNKDTVSDKALQATKSLFEESTKSNAASSGFQTASGNKVTVSDKALQATKPLFEESTKPNAASSGFQTASGNKVTVSDKALQATKSLFEESTKPNAASSGFQTASGNNVTVLEKSLQATKSFFEENKKPSSTICGKIDTASDLDPRQSSFEANIQPKSTFPGFETAGGNKVSVSDEALQATGSKANLICTDMLPSDDRQADVQALLDDGDFEEDVVPDKMKVPSNHYLQKNRPSTESDKTKVCIKLPVQKNRLAGKPVAGPKPFITPVKSSQTKYQAPLKQKLSCGSSFIAPMKNPSATQSSFKDPTKKATVKAVTKESDVIEDHDFDHIDSQTLAQLMLDENEPEDNLETNPVEKRVMVANEICKKRLQARVAQAQRIKKKKECGDTKPIMGSLYREKIKVKADGRRLQISDVALYRPGLYLDYDLYSLGIRPSTLMVTSKTAEDFRFNISDYFGEETAKMSESVWLGDGTSIILDEYSTIGKEEFCNALYDMEGVEPKLINREWVYNHYRWIVWKLAAYEVTLPHNFASRTLEPSQVMLQLKYRYDREVDNSQRSALKKILEKDDSSQKCMVLCVSDILSKTGETAGCMVEVTDGWYPLKAVLDAPLSRHVDSRRLQVGDKIVVCGAEMMGHQDGCSPLEVPCDVMLKICANSCRKAKWSAKLGFCSNPQPVALSLSSLYPDGGLVGCVDVIITRVYPVQYMEKPAEGSSVFRCERAEEKAAKVFESIRQKHLETLYAKLQQEFEQKSEKLRNPHNTKKWSKAEVKQLHSGRDLLEAFNCAMDGSHFESLLTGQQFEMLQESRCQAQIDEQAELQAQLQKQFLECNSEIPERKVTSLLKIRLAGCTISDIDTSSGCVLTIWRHSEDVRALLKEGQRFKMYNLTAGENRGRPTPTGRCNVTFTATRTTRYQAIPTDDNFVDLVYEPREVVGLSELSSAFQPPYGELDVVIVVLEVSQPNVFDTNSGREGCVQSVYIADINKAVAVLKFWGKLGNYGLEELLTTGRILACTNLSYKTGRYNNMLPSLTASEMSVFTTNPKQKYLQIELEKLARHIKASGTFVQDMQDVLQQKVTGSLPRQNKYGKIPYSESYSTISTPDSKSSCTTNEKVNKDTNVDLASPVLKNADDVINNANTVEDVQPIKENDVIETPKGHDSLLSKRQSLQKSKAAKLNSYMDKLEHYGSPIAMAPLNNLVSPISGTLKKAFKAPGLRRRSISKRSISESSSTNQGVILKEINMSEDVKLDQLGTRSNANESSNSNMCTKVCLENMEPETISTEGTNLSSSNLLLKPTDDVVNRKSLSSDEYVTRLPSSCVRELRSTSKPVSTNSKSLLKDEQFQNKKEKVTLNESIKQNNKRKQMHTEEMEDASNPSKRRKSLRLSKNK